MEEKVISKYRPGLKEVYSARERLNSVVNQTPLLENRNLSDYFQARIYLKREDLQTVRSYKIRGAYNKMKSLGSDEKKKTGSSAPVQEIMPREWPTPARY